MDLAIVQDVIDRWRPLSESEQDLAGVLIADASDMIRVRWTDIDTRISNGEVAASTARRIVAGMVRRAMMNRDVEGVTQHTEVAGPYTQAASYANPTNNLYLTADDIRALDPAGFRPRVRNGWLA